MKLSYQDLVDHRQLFRQVRVVIVQLEIPEDTVLRAAELAAEQEAIFILNPAPARALSDDLLAQVDYLTPNETELASLSGMKVEDIATAEIAAGRLISKGVANVIVTLGDQGSLLVTSNIAQLFPTRSVEAVDTTAAGDAFNGALALAIAEGQDVNEAIRFANTVASTSVTVLGAQSSMPYRETIQTILEG
jgi:ribokinase